MADILQKTHERLLLAKSHDGDQEAFAQLFHAYRDKLYAFILKLSGSRETAEDVVQDVFMRIWMKRHQLNEIENFSAFVFRMARNDAVNQLMRASRQSLLLKQSRYADADPYVAPDESLTLSHIRQSLTEIVDHLPPQQKTVYQLSREKNLKHTEIAAYMHLSPSTVKNHLNQALKTIQRGLQKYMPLLVLSCFFMKIR